MTRVLVASNGHKGLLSPVQACEAIARGLAGRGLDVAIAPMADGGDGLIEVLRHGRGGHTVQVPAHDALFRERTATLGLFGSGAALTGVVEIADTAGSAILQPHERQTVVATSYGVGEVILAAIDAGCRRVVVGLGGSIVTDGGMGLAQALGVRFLDRESRPLRSICNPGFNSLSLAEVWRVDRSGLRYDPSAVDMVVAADVDTVLLGPRGQAATFGPQKGANAVEIAYFERGLANFAAAVERSTGVAVDIPMAGAAGGMAAGLHGILGARLQLGAEFVAAELGLEQRIRASDLLVVGEGMLDASTLHNKGPYYLAGMARAWGIPVLAVVGAARITPDIFHVIRTAQEADAPCPDTAAAAQGLAAAASAAADALQFSESSDRNPSP